MERLKVLTNLGTSVKLSKNQNFYSSIQAIFLKLRKQRTVTERKQNVPRKNKENEKMCRN